MYAYGIVFQTPNQNQIPNQCTDYTIHKNETTNEHDSGSGTLDRRANDGVH